MTDIAIQSRNISKQYSIGGQKRLNTSFREVFTDALTSPLRRIAQTIRQGPASASGLDERFWALQDVSFDISRGKAVGLIGRNGAGKSTLLKILSRITTPTEGTIDLYGRVGSLLEVGTGFHQELTGRENVFLNGAILGMSNLEIMRKFDEIVAFAGVEKFIDTPVKHYSSGMRLRLGFAVAAHLETEILLVDEVLAVGDAEFQKKCLGKMGEVANEGRTVVFVSHNMTAVRELTDQCIYLSNGTIHSYDLTPNVIQQYLLDALEQHQLAKSDNLGSLDYFRRQNNPDAPCKFKSITVNDCASGFPSMVMGDDLTIRFGINCNYTKLRHVIINIVLRDMEGNRTALISSIDNPEELVLTYGDNEITITLTSIPIVPGRYFADIGIGSVDPAVGHDTLSDYPLIEVSIHPSLSIWPDRPWGIAHIDTTKWTLN